ncbi:hypothetical protein ABIB81_008953, partial [Bradyrhizobium sp. I1.7.5]
MSEKALRNAAGDRGASSIPVLGDSFVYCWQREGAGFDRLARFVLHRQIEQPLLGKGVSFVCQLTDQICPVFGVGPSGRTGWLSAIDRAAGLSEDEGPWQSIEPTASSSNGRCHRSI